MIKKQTFVDNIGTTNIRTSDEINFQKQRIEMLSHMSALEVTEAPFVYITRQMVSTILTRIQLFEKILDVHGSIVECGVHRANSLMVFEHLSSILEPMNSYRKVIGFDTFEGFPSGSTNDADVIVGHFRNTDYEHLLNWVALHDQNRPLGHMPKVDLVKGDATKTIPQFVKDHPELIIALLYMDFDIYEPTAVALKHLLPLVPKGGVVGFDEVGQKRWQGETIALKENVILSGVRLQRFYFNAAVSYYVVE